jgi:hypothetical protein
MIRIEDFQLGRSVVKRVARALEAWCSRQAEIDRRAAHYRTIEEGAAA